VAVTEQLIIQLLPNANFEDVIKDLSTIWSGRKGFLSGYWGTSKEDTNVIEIINCKCLDQDKLEVLMECNLARRADKAIRSLGES
jgi:hypothetical protein